MTSSLLPAIILGVIALFAIAVILLPLIKMIPSIRGKKISWSMISPVKYLRKLRVKTALKGIESNFKIFEDCLREGDFGRAEQSLKTAVDSACSMTALSPEGVVGQLLGALSHILSLADKHQIHIENLELVEELIHDRGALLRGVAEAERSRLALKKRRTEGRKEIPEWAVLELKKQFETLSEQLHTNRLSLLSQFTEAFQSIIKARSRVSLTVH